MADQHSVCRLCCDTVKETEIKVINEDLGRMLQSVLIKIDLTVSEKPGICNKCRKKLETNYNFKRKCVFTEDSISPFVAENVKLNLKEIRNQIIKSEDIEDDKNVCRLCLQFVDYDMTLSDSEKGLFQQFFPEINLSRTIFVILCSTCYDLLHKYFMFVTSCLELEQQLCNYSLDQAENIDVAEEHVSIKLENFQEFLKTIKKEIKEEEILNEELDIKCDMEEDDERFNVNNQEVEQSLIIKKEESISDIFSDDNICIQREKFNKMESHKNYFTNNTGPQGSTDRKNAAIHTTIFSCEHCHQAFETEDGLKRHSHTNLTWHQCKHCSRHFKRKSYLKEHILCIHTDPSKTTMYKCEQCGKKFKQKHVLRRHILTVHTDSSEMTIYKCTQCIAEFKLNWCLKKHILRVHTDPSKITWYQCEQCDKKCKDYSNLQKHVRNKHTASSEIIWYDCEHCDKKFKQKNSLNQHTIDIHTDSSKIAWYQCEHCDKRFKQKYNLSQHITDKHTDPSKITMYKCEQCGRKFKQKQVLKRHVLAVHTDSSEITIYKCTQCDAEFKRKWSLKQHVLHVHTDLSKINIYKCEECDRGFKQNGHLKAHMLTVHTDPSKVNWHQCEQCDKKFKQKQGLKKHISNKHIESFQNN